ncbi:hypothetical protein [Burkholderia sp. JP2-270]|nr:hypothetical protein [Burkholderia sp. JP2-270]
MIAMFKRSSLAAHLLDQRDWHPLVALVVLYLIASAIAPEFGL